MLEQIYSAITNSFKRIENLRRALARKQLQGLPPDEQQNYADRWSGAEPTPMRNRGPTGLFTAGSRGAAPAGPVGAGAAAGHAVAAGDAEAAPQDGFILMLFAFRSFRCVQKASICESCPENVCSLVSLCRKLVHHVPSKGRWGEKMLEHKCWSIEVRWKCQAEEEDVGASQFVVNVDDFMNIML